MEALFGELAVSSGQGLGFAAATGVSYCAQQTAVKAAGSFAEDTHVI
jgi:hypothetical protein